MYDKCIARQEMVTKMFERLKLEKWNKNAGDVNDDVAKAEHEITIF